MDMVPAEVVLQLGTERLTARFSVANEPLSTPELLPIARAIAEKVIGQALADLPKDKHVTCKAGCGACCRQLVPISEPEAFMLVALVRDMPAVRRQAILERFRDAEAKLVKSGLWDLLSNRANWEPEHVRTVGLDYFHQGIPCPFLEDESCSIHPDRPISCREYLVTSDPKYCAEVKGEKIDMVPLPLKVSSAMNRMARMEATDVFLPWVPLTQIIAWAMAGPEPPIEKPGPELVEDFFRKLSTPKGEPAA